MNPEVILNKIQIFLSRNTNWNVNKKKIQYHKWAVEALCRWTGNELTQHVARECGSRSIRFSCLWIFRKVIVCRYWLTEGYLWTARIEHANNGTSNTAAQLADGSRWRLRQRHGNIRTENTNTNWTPHWNSRINAAHKIKQVRIRFVADGNTSLAFRFDSIFCAFACHNSFPRHMWANMTA